MSRIVAVCDDDTAYLTNFYQYFRKKRITDIELIMFGDVGKLQAYLSETKISLLVISSLYEEAQNWGKYCEKVLVLSNGERHKSMYRYPVCYKFRSGEEIIKNIMDALTDLEEDDKIRVRRERSKLISVYSPGGGCGKTTFSICFAKALAWNDKKVLLINLEDYSGLCEVLTDENRGDIIDFLYYMRERPGNAEIKISSMVGRFEEFDYIAPARFSGEIKCISEEEMVRTVEGLKYSSGYDYVVLDLGSSVNGLVSILEISEFIFIPIKSDYIIQKKVEQFQTGLKGIGKEEVVQKMIFIELPQPEGGCKGEAFYQEALSGEFGRYVKDAVREMIYEK